MTTATSTFNSVIERGAKRRRGGAAFDEKDVRDWLETRRLSWTCECDRAEEMFGGEDVLPDIFFDDAATLVLGQDAVMSYRRFNGPISGRRELFESFGQSVDATTEELCQIWHRGGAVHYASHYGAELMKLDGAPFIMRGIWTLGGAVERGIIDVDVDEFVRECLEKCDDVSEAFDALRDYVKDRGTWCRVTLGV